MHHACVQHAVTCQSSLFQCQHPKKHTKQTHTHKLLHNVFCPVDVASLMLFIVFMRLLTPFLHSQLLPMPPYMACPQIPATFRVLPDDWAVLEAGNQREWVGWTPTFLLWCVAEVDNARVRWYPSLCVASLVRWRRKLVVVWFACCSVRG